MSKEKSPSDKLADSIAERLFKIEGVTNAEEVLALIEESASTISRKQRGSLARKAVQVFMQLDTTTEVDRVIEFAVHQLLPLCLQSKVEQDKENEAGPGQTATSLYRFRDLLGDWVRSFPIDHRLKLVDALHERLNANLSASTSTIEFSVVSAIGYRTDAIVSKLLTIARSKGEFSKKAIGTLIELGVGPDDRHEIIALVRDLLHEHGPIQCVRVAVSTLCGPEDIDLAKELVLAASSLDPKTYDKAMALTAAANAVDRCPSGWSIHEEMWQLLREHRETIKMNAQFAFGCETPNAVSDYLSWMTDRADISDPDINIEISYSRIEELTKPGHLKGFDLANNGRVRDCLQHFATKDTEIKGMCATTALRSKKDAWELLQCLSDDPLDDLLFDAVWNETSSSASHSVAVVAASAQIARFDSRLCDKIRSQAFHASDVEEGQWARELGLIELAHGSGTSEAYDAVLEFAYLHNGDVLQSFVDAIVDLAIHRMRLGDTNVISRLLSKTDVRCDSHHRAAAVSAFCEIMIRGEMSESDSSHVWAFLSDTTLDDLAHRDSLEAIACSDVPIAEDNLVVVCNLALTDSSDLGWRAWEVLIRRQLLDTNDLMSQLLVRLEMSDSAVGVRFLTPQAVNSWQAYLAGLLFTQQVERFSPSICDLLAMSRPDCVHQVIEPIEGNAGGLTSDLRASLVKCVVASNNSGRTDTVVTRLLGRVAPRELLELVDSSAWREWMPAGRVALCEAVVSAGSTVDDGIERPSQCLIEFMRDAEFAVRRVAYRGLAKLDQQTLIDTIESWSAATNPELTSRAAEGIRWISLSHLTDEDLRNFGFQWHSDPKVRELATDAITDRRDRQWASEYFANVKNAAELNLLSAPVYRRGRALIALGDDECIEQIEKLLVDSPISPRIRKWLVRLRKELKKAWKQKTAKWCDPWMHAVGTLEHLPARLRDDEGNEYETEIWLWRQERRTQSERYSWGGTVPSFDDRSKGFFIHVKDRFRLRIDGRSEATVQVFGTHMSSQQSTRLTFFGASEYPSATKES